MSIHVQTGNALDVVYDYVDGKQVLKGLCRHDASQEIIPLRDPRALISVLTKVVEECERTPRRGGRR